VPSPRITSPEALPLPTLIEDQEGVERLLAVFATAKEVAVDTEADSFFRYQERVCLIQISVGEQDFLVDPLRDLDLSGVGRMLADPDCVKVFHDGEYDVLMLKRDFGFHFRNLFDTRIAASALGDELPGLASVVHSRFGIELDKSQQRSNWSNRPLSEKQIRYARLDTRYLVALMEQVRRELTERNRMMIVEGECRRLEALEPTHREFNPDGFVRIKGARLLDLRQARLLRELFRRRDELAEARDVPPFKVLGNVPLLEIARALPSSVAEIERVPGISPKLARRIGHELLEAIRRAEELGPLTSLPHLPAKDGTGVLDDAGHELHDRLKNWRKGRAKIEELDSSLVLNRLALLRLACERPRDLAALSAVEGVLAWQVESFGGELVPLIDGFERDLAAGKIEFKQGRKGRGRKPRRG
jgi:ribonuclease D